MNDEECVFIQNRNEFYAKHYRAGEAIDIWHLYAQQVVHSMTRKWFYELGRTKGSRILNAGSGGSDYGIASPMVHLDVVAARVADQPGSIIADIANIPLPGGTFDIVLCVGSVINYANPALGIQEFQRVLRPGGLLILEYERSGSPEYWSKNGISAPCVCVTSFYGKAKTQLWVYSDQFIDHLLNLRGFKQIVESRFHGFSSLVLAVTRSPKLATRCVWGDRFMANTWPLSRIASNRILAVEKLADKRD